MPRKGYRSPLDGEGRLNYITLWRADLIAAFSHSIEDTDVLGAMVLLWAHSTLEDPPGTLPDDMRKWAFWTRKTPKKFKKYEKNLKKNWDFNPDTSRWEIRRVIEQYEKVIEVSRARRSARLGTPEPENRNNCSTTQVLSNSNTNSNTKIKSEKSGDFSLRDRSGLHRLSKIIRETGKELDANDATK